jgi:hypothetical protein
VDSAPGPAAGEGFAIYLTAGGLRLAQMQAASLREVRAAAAPLISPADILAYHPAGHELELTPAALERLRKLAVPTTGIPFFVCVDGRPVYWVPSGHLSRRPVSRGS